MTFIAIDGETTRIADEWKLPAGYSQRVVSDESHLDIYPGSDWNDMITANEDPNDPEVGRYLYRTHEVRPYADRLASYTGGAISVVDLQTGAAKILVQRRDWEALDGIVWTPWNTLLVNEEISETLLPPDEAPNAKHGLVYEISLVQHTQIKSVAVRPQIGSMAHEGIELDAEGNVYVIDEYHSGGIYKFVPEVYGDLAKGDLYALMLDTRSRDKTGPATWIKLDRSAVQISARQAAAAIGASSWNRPEDLERIGDTLYIAITGEDRVLAVSLKGKPMVSTFVDGGNADTPTATFRKIDNLASGPDGRLWIVEDNKPSDIWVADPDRNQDGRSDRVRLFASFNDGKAEGTGIYFGRDPNTLFVNIQHSANGNDRTIAISRDPNDAQ